MTPQSTPYPKPSAEQLNLIERFLAAFNQIETHLRFELQELDDHRPFTSLVYAYGERNWLWEG